MKINGQKIICDRCGEETFVKCTGEKEMDGGFTRWNTFEKAEGWGYEYEFGDLCPDCLAEWEEMKTAFAIQQKKWKEKKNE